MADQRLNAVTVIGAGVLGGQVAWHSAFKGKTVTLYDLYPQALEKAKAETLTAATRFVIEIGQVPIPVQKPQNGYVLNSWLVPLVRAALSLVANGVSSPEDVDRTFMIANRGCALGPCGIVDVVGMKPVYDISSYWGSVNNDAQMLKNAAYIKERFLDKGLQGLQGGEGFYRYPNPAYASPEFLAVPSVSSVPEIVARIGVKQLSQ